MFSLDDLTDFITDSDEINDEEKSWLLKNISHVRTKFIEKFGKDIKL